MCSPWSRRSPPSVSPLTPRAFRCSGPRPLAACAAGWRLFCRKVTLPPCSTTLPLQVRLEGALPGRQRTLPIALPVSARGLAAGGVAPAGDSLGVVCRCLPGGRLPPATRGAPRVPRLVRAPPDMLPQGPAPRPSLVPPGRLGFGVGLASLRVSPPSVCRAPRGVARAFPGSALTFLSLLPEGNVRLGVLELGRLRRPHRHGPRAGLPRSPAPVVLPRRFFRSPPLFGPE